MESLKKWIKLVVCVAFGILFSVGGILLTIFFIWNKSLWAIFSFIFIFLGFYLFKSIREVGPKNMAVFVFLSELTGFRDSGVYFAPWIISELITFPKKMFQFDYEEQIPSGAGWYRKIGEVGNTNGDELEYYEKQILKVKFTVYLNFPRELRSKKNGDILPSGIELDKEGVEKTHPLIKITKSDIPTSEEGLSNWIKPIAVSTLRSVIGEITWGEAWADIEKIREKAGANFKAPDGTLITTGFSAKGVILHVTVIDPPEKIEKGLSYVDEERLGRKAAQFTASRTAKETFGAVIDILSETTGETRDVLSTKISENPKGFLDKYGDIWKSAIDVVIRERGMQSGSYLDIRSANALQDIVSLFKKIPNGGGGTPPANRSSEVPFSAEEKKQMIKKANL
jgi:hypothetical protein